MHTCAQVNIHFQAMQQQLIMKICKPGLKKAEIILKVIARAWHVHHDKQFQANPTVALIFRTLKLISAIKLKIRNNDRGLHVHIIYDQTFIKLD